MEQLTAAILDSWATCAGQGYYRSSLKFLLFQIHIESYTTSESNTEPLVVPWGKVGKLKRQICKNHIVITTVQA